MRYPELSYYKTFSNRDLQELYNDLQQWSAQLIQELDSRDISQDFQGIKYVITETTTTNYKKATGGSVVYSTSAGKYYGWNALTSAWDAFA